MKKIIIKPVSGYEAKLFYNKVFAPSWWPENLQPQEHAIRVPDDFVIVISPDNPFRKVTDDDYIIRAIFGDGKTVYLECGENALRIEYAIVDGVKIPADYEPCECDVRRSNLLTITKPVI